MMLVKKTRYLKHYIWFDEDGRIKYKAITLKALHRALKLDFNCEICPAKLRCLGTPICDREDMGSGYIVPNQLKIDSVMLSPGRIYISELFAVLKLPELKFSFEGMKIFE